MGPLLDHEHVGLSTCLVLVGDAAAGKVVILAEWTYSPSTYTTSLAHVLRFLRCTYRCSNRRSSRPVPFLVSLRDLRTRSGHSRTSLNFVDDTHPLSQSCRGGSELTEGADERSLARRRVQDLRHGWDIHEKGAQAILRSEREVDGILPEIRARNHCQFEHHVAIRSAFNNEVGKWTHSNCECEGAISCFQAKSSDGRLSAAPKVGSILDVALEFQSGRFQKCCRGFACTFRFSRGTATWMLFHFQQGRDSRTLKPLPNPIAACTCVHI